MIGSTVEIINRTCYFYGGIGIIIKRARHVYDWIVLFPDNTETPFSNYEFKIIKRRDLGLFV